MTISASLQSACDRATAAAESGELRALELAALVRAAMVREAEEAGDDTTTDDDDEPTTPDLPRPE